MRFPSRARPTTYFTLYYDSPVGTAMTGGASTKTLVDYVNYTAGMSISGISTLDATGLGSVTLTADQVSEFSTINAGGGEVDLGYRWTAAATTR